MSTFYALLKSSYELGRSYLVTMYTYVYAYSTNSERLNINAKHVSVKTVSDRITSGNK